MAPDRRPFLGGQGLAARHSRPLRVRTGRHNARGTSLALPWSLFHLWPPPHCPHLPPPLDLIHVLRARLVGGDPRPHVALPWATVGPSPHRVAARPPTGLSVSRAKRKPGDGPEHMVGAERWGQPPPPPPRHPPSQTMGRTLPARLLASSPAVSLMSSGGLSPSPATSWR